ncbi:secondary thiamine-phosphate synthase enzyme YjbQ [Caloramator sp. mosi_1]|uniref:secondary thiamine-phosphate synthase enzyme YjbQ n=1 Tax=Caloramator sp. mosi_1 TaxID=3023090 RepID=UPI002362D8FF|nr:secondary thiamine-phosphate synthase enzyme YjbQ [Caloramator sp. mosi_1]WDC83665.1 secondary thiamine-phosphate synthase enzyme YjbQ [Caloramator sp. mosi_1]
MEFSLKTSKMEEFINITSFIREAVSKSGVKNGLAVVFVPHTTAGVTINENADPDVVRDMLVTLDKVYPIKGDYWHIEGNSHAHIKASLMGSSCSIIVEDGNLKLGTWQGVYFCEFDGPRTRKFYVKILNG